MRKNILILVLIFNLFGCKKQIDPLPLISEPLPIFYLEGLFRGKPILIQAGVNNIYMNTYDTVYPLSPGVYFNKFLGEFGPINCRKCKGNFLFTLNDLKPSSSSLLNYFDSVVYPGNSLVFARPGFSSTSRLIIDYYTENGVLFTSESSKQPFNSKFFIESVEEYSVNLQGKKTKKIKAKFSCRLYNPNILDSISLQNMEVVFALSRN